jgi:hypothetical protein
VGKKGSKRDQKKRLVVRKRVAGPEEDATKDQEPAASPTRTRRVVAKVPMKEPAEEPPKVRKVASSTTDQKTQDPSPPPVVKRAVKTAPAKTGEPVRKQVERVVVRQRPRDAIPSTPDELESGYNYLIEEPQPKRSFEYFKAKVSQGSKGLCISTSYPKKIIEEYGLHGTTVYWLSELEFDNQSLHPRRLDFEVTRAIQNFVKSNPSSVLIIDGVEFLILINGFERVMTFIKKMNDIMSATASTLITSINPSAFSEEKLSIIEREFDRVFKFTG